MGNFYRFLIDYYNKITNKLYIRNLLDEIENFDVKKSDKIFILSQRGGGIYGKLYLLIAHALLKKGYACFFLFKDKVLEEFPPKLANLILKFGVDESSFLKNYSFNSYFPPLIIDGERISDSLSEYKGYDITDDDKNRKLYFKWTVDYEKEKLEARGINLFLPIRNTMRVIHKRYNIDFTRKDIISTCNRLMYTTDLLLHHFLLLKKYATQNNVKIRIIGWESEFMPNNIFRILCEKFSENRNMEYIAVQRGYPAYYGYNFRESYIMAVSMTYSKVVDYLAITKEELNQIKDYNFDKSEITSFFDKILKIDEEPKFNSQQQKVIDIINDYRSQNKNIFVLFTHLFHDTPLDDSSPSFDNMCEWFTETIDFFKKHDDLLILKPHPIEVLPEFPEKEPTETLASYLKDNKIKYGDNVILLEPRLFSIKDLYPYFTCGLIWRSSVGMELTYLKKPTIISGYPVYNALNLNYSKNKKHYFDLIKNANKLKVTDDQVLEVIKYLYCMKIKHVYIDQLRYDDRIMDVYWDRKLLHKYLKEGDDKVNLLVDMILKQS